MLKKILESSVSLVAVFGFLAICVLIVFGAYAHADSRDSEAGNNSSEQGSAKVFDVNGKVLGYITNTTLWPTEIDMMDKRLGVIERISFNQDSAQIINPLGSQSTFIYQSSDCTGMPYVQSNYPSPISSTGSLIERAGGGFFIVDLSKPTKHSFQQHSYYNGVCTSANDSILVALPLKDVTAIINSYHVGRIGI